jgi:hypothetical protein
MPDKHTKHRRVGVQIDVCNVSNTQKHRGGWEGGRERERGGVREREREGWREREREGGA